MAKKITVRVKQRPTSASQFMSMAKAVGRAKAAAAKPRAGGAPRPPAARSGGSIPRPPTFKGEPVRRRSRTPRG